MLLKLTLKLLLLVVLVDSSYGVELVSVDENGVVKSVHINEKVDSSKDMILPSFVGNKKSIEESISDKKLFGLFPRNRVINTENYPERTIGHIGLACSGTLIGPRHVLTAAHCVYNQEKKSWYSGLYFSPGRVKVGHSPYGIINWKKVYVKKSYIEGSEEEFSDYALIELKKDIGKLVGWSGVKATKDDGFKSIRILGYPSDKAIGTMWTVKCEGKLFSDEIAYHCDTYGGMSGSGIRIKDKENTEYVSGIHTYGSKIQNGGVKITPAVFKVIKAWLDGSLDEDSTSNMGNSKDFDFYSIIFENKCDKEIRTAIAYKNLKGQWVTRAYLRFKPDQMGIVADTRNLSFFFYGQTKDKKISWSGDLPITIKGVELGFRARTISNKQWGYKRVTFNCK